MNAMVSDRPLLLSSDGRNLKELDDDMIWSALDKHGAILFRDFVTDPEGFYDYASRFSKGFLVSPFKDRKAASDRNELQTVTLGQAGLNLHFEYGNTPIRPDLLWFYCRQAPAAGTGGETLVADGIAIFDKLAPQTQEALCARRIRYRNFLPLHAFESILSKNSVVGSLLGSDVMAALGQHHELRVVEENPSRVVFDFIVPSVLAVSNGEKTKVCQNIVTNAYKKPTDNGAEDSFSTLVTWEDGEEIAQPILDDLKDATKSLTRGIRWRTGDFVLIDNNRVLHGRNHTSDPQRDIVMLSSFSTRWRCDDLAGQREAGGLMA